MIVNKVYQRKGKKKKKGREGRGGGKREIVCWLVA